MDTASPNSASKPTGRFAIGEKVTGIYADRRPATVNWAHGYCRVREVRVTGTIVFVNEPRGTVLVEFDREVRSGVRGAIFFADELEAA